MNLPPIQKSRTAEILKRLKAGERPTHIARDLGITEQAVSKARKRAGLPAVPRGFPAFAKSRERLRDEQDLMMLSLREQGRQHAEIAALMGLTRCAVVARVNKIKREMD